MVKIHMGRAGRVWDATARLVKNARDEKQRVVLLVPGQYTLQTERDLMTALRSGGFFDVDVLSPARLTQRVFAQAGGDERVRVDARGKAMAVAGALLSCRSKLAYYESAANKQGLVERMGTLIADFKRALVTPQALSDYAQTLPQGAARAKMADIALIYQTYEAILADRFVDGEDVQQALSEKVAQAQIIRDACLIVYGFDVITGEMSRLLEKAEPAVSALHVLLCADPSSEAFSPVVDSVRRFEAGLKKAGIGYEETLIKAPLDAPRDIAAVEASLLAARPAPCLEPCGAVRLYAAPTPYAEAHFVAREMLLLAHAGMPFSGMQVLCCDENRYFSTLDAVLTSYQIPHYLARKVCAADVGAARFLIGALRAVGSGFRAEDVLDVLRTGYLPVSADERFLMENYILAYGIRGSMFSKPFVRGGDQAVRLDGVRAKMMEPLMTLKAGLHDARDADGALTAVMGLLHEVGAYEKLTDDAQTLEALGMPARAAQLRQVWKTLMGLLDQMHELLAGARLSGATAAVWLEAGLDKAELSALPQDAQSAMCGLIGNVAHSRPEALFVMGLNDGVMNASEGGLLSDEEQASAQKGLGVYLSADADGRERLSRLDAYKAFSSPAKKLFLSHAQALQDGMALRPHALIKSVRAILPALIEEGGVTAPQGASMPFAVTPALEGLGALMREGELCAEWRGAWRWLCENDTMDAKKLLMAFERAAESAPLPAQVTHELFMERIVSVNRLETFAVCPFKHFVMYGLKPVERAEWKIGGRDAGSFYHAALEGFTRLLSSAPQWPDITRSECNALIERASSDAMNELLTGVMGDSARARAAGEEYRRLLRRVAWTFTLAARQSKFRPEGAEVTFGYDGGLPPVRLTLEDGTVCLVRGKIDRIDRYAGDEGVYLRVIDYKSYNSELSPQGIYWGTQLQLLIYLDAALNEEKDAQPAGAFYFRVQDPLLDEKNVKDDLEKALARKLCLQGVTLRDAEVVRLMDSGDPPLSMPQMLKKDGDFYKEKQLATLEQMRALIDHTRRTAARLAQAISSGDVSASPIAFSGEDSRCAKCAYSAICRANAPGGNVTPRAKEKLDFDRLLDAVTEEK